MSSPDSMLTASEVARYFRLHVMTIYRMVQRRELPAVRVGRQWRFRREQINQWLQDQGRGNSMRHSTRSARRRS
jgi:excisionase family DNA binding protein